MLGNGGKGMIGLADIFTDHMIFQRNMEILIWGTSDREQEITAKFDGESQTVRAGQGYWEVLFSPREAGGPFRLDVYGERVQIRREDIYTGEVWIAAGQSNMALPLSECNGGGEELNAATDGLLRFYIQPGISDTGEKESPGLWRACTAGEFGSISGTAYFCAQRLRAELRMPVGIIMCCHPGTAIACWMNEKGSELPEETREERRRSYEQFWEAKRNGSNEWPPPVWEGSPFWPGSLYRCMVRAIAPYRARGVLYYQGEEDCRAPEGYSEKMCTLVQEWRNIWRQENLYFVMAQLPMYGGEEYEEESWARLREQQEQAAEHIKDMLMVILIDCGEKDNIHPTDKKTPGVRMALRCLEGVYGKGKLTGGPRLASALLLEGGHVHIKFLGGNGGLCSVDTGEGTLLELSGKDGKYVPAEMEIHGDELEVWNESLSDPVRVRYAFRNYGKAHLYDEDGFPVAPFQSDLGPCLMT